MPRLILPALFLALLSALINGNAAARTPFTSELDPAWLKEVMPQAQAFSGKEGEPPVFKGYRNEGDGQQELVGYVFFTPDLPPEEKGYAAPIDMLVGLDLDNRITGMKIVDYVESYRYSRGDFLAEEGFQEQFSGKSIRDDFRVRHDVDGVTNATVSSWAIARAIRNSSRKVAKAYLQYEEGESVEQTWASNAREQLEQFSWQDLLDRGVVVQGNMQTPIGSELQLSIAYFGHKALGEYFVGEEDYAAAERNASIRFDTRQMVMVAVGGEGSQYFRQERLAVQQGQRDPRRVHPRRIINAGGAGAGMVAGHANYTAGIALEEDFDPTQPFSIIYEPLGSEPLKLDYQVTGVALALARGDPVFSLAEIEQARLAEAGLLTRLREAPPWGETPWRKVTILLLVLGLATTAFLRKSARLRWIALTVTLLYLGFYSGGFLSVSHITGALMQGPAILLNDLTVLTLVVFTLVTTLLWGRVFCSSLCPFGALQDFLTRFAPRRWQVKMPQAIHDRALYIKYGVLALIVGTALVRSDISIFQYFEPFGTLFFLSSSLILWTILIAILLGSLLISRFYCRYVCPLGAALGVVSLVSPFRIKRVPQCELCKLCEHVCPTAAIRGPEIDFKECVRCDICEIKLIDRAGTCRHSMEEIANRMNKGVEAVRIIESPVETT